MAGRSQKTVKAYLQVLRVAAWSWTIDAIILAASVSLTGESLFVPFLYLAIGLCYSSLVYVATKRGYTERFTDPTLSFPQLVIATSTQCLCLWLAPDIGIFFLINIFQIFAYGLFFQSLRQFRKLLLTTTALSGLAFIAAGKSISFPVDTVLGRVLLFATFILALARFVWVVNYINDLRKRIAAKTEALIESEARFRALTELSSDWYWEQDANLCFTRISSGREDQVLPKEALLGKHPWESDFEIELSGGWDAYRDLTARFEEYRDLVIKRVSANDKEYFVSLSGSPIFDHDGRCIGYRGVAREITEKRLAEKHIQHLATHDALTGLPNRLLFNELVDVAVQTADRNGKKFALLFIDLDRFKLINDTLGHEAGDALLKELANRFRQALRTSDIVARLGGDEFVVLIQELQDDTQVTSVANKVLSAAHTPVFLSGHECRVSASVGVSIFPKDGENAAELLRSADSAMYLAKENGKNSFQLYSGHEASYARERIVLETELRYALERNEFEVHYQAKRDLRSGIITGVEALLRWNNPRLGAVPPVQFIPIAEETSLIISIGKWVLRTACEQNMAWQREGLMPVSMSVNLSVRQFSDNRLIEDIAAVLQETGLPPHLLELEITEGMVIHNADRVIKSLKAIKELGVRIALDDFGTGYSSFGYLREFPVDAVKVDRSFIRDIIDNTEDRAITEAIITMARTLRLNVVAEGVETADQEAFLRSKGCDEAQGYFISRPIPRHEFAQLLRSQMEAQKVTG